jgi:hypothetical protein
VVDAIGDFDSGGIDLCDNFNTGGYAVFVAVGESESEEIFVVSSINNCLNLI